MTPTATYRLQLQPEFPFPAAEKAVPYLAALGVSHLHLSPVLESVPGSTHGYDVVDPTRVREELGGEDGLRALARTARAHGLRLVLDIVPNHMAASPRFNRPLWEVLREGPSSPFARWFDIDWDGGDGRILLPVLGHRLGVEWEQLRVEKDQLHYYDHTFPLREGTQGLPMPELLDAQFYRLAWWRLARTDLNYRRFFTISDLIGIRVEDPEVFHATHAKILELLRDGVADGLRIDHPDGLADPGTYLRRLSEATGSRWTVVEKILTGDEPLAADWAVAGTTGYDALHRIDGVFTDPQGADELSVAYRDFTGLSGDRGGYWEATVRRAAYKVLTHELAAETEFLVRTAARICAADPALRDHAPRALRIALRELLVRVPVYRPYVTPGGHPDRTSPALPPEALHKAAASYAVPEEAEALSVVRDLALGTLGEGPDHTAFCARFAQTASALRAKSVEDTAFYRYAPLLSAAEVGGDPGVPAVSPEAFHTFCARIARDWPGTGTVLTTHDTKRSADVRARIAVLTQCPSQWGELLQRLSAVRAPDPQVAWTAWQTAFGFGLPDRGRLGPALLKSVREAGLHTSWTEQDPVYEEAVEAFVAAGPCGPQHTVLAEFSRRLDPHARANALGAALVQLTMPGVPDLYQGSEGTYIALVDPDNRAPFHPTDPSDEKVALTTAALQLRRRLPDAFGESGTYVPLAANGPAAAHCLAFCRSGEAVTVVTRLSLRLAEAGGWRDTELPLPEGAWTELLSPGREFTGRVLLGELFADRPVALLTRVVRADSEGSG
ncbi:malto-oligosyltrehalose synthase [Streptomyces sp. NPDC050738]|uniref:malto-oligosyltrehalose synthase n=1 Tax=Streptomyces sp. NPDC050738 TaxID=3154744 RepID=UPI00343681DC